jgi:hypothetical protein
MGNAVIQSARQNWRYGDYFSEFVRLSGEATGDEPPALQLAALVDSCEETAESFGLTLENIVHHRLWLRSHAARAEVDEPRAVLLGGARRAASSSFVSAARFREDGAVALDLLLQRPRDGGTRRLVDFAPPRRYAWYLLQDDWQHFSGMAEQGQDLAAQFRTACDVIEDGLAAEGRNWALAIGAHLFLQHGRGDEIWLRNSFARRSGMADDLILFDWVDALASPAKHLEIEIVVRPQD